MENFTETEKSKISALYSLVIIGHRTAITATWTTHGTTVLMI